VALLDVLGHYNIPMYECIVCLLPLANVSAQRMRRTHAFVAVRGGNMAMWPFARLLWTLVDTEPFIIIVMYVKCL